jgi:hypothetical protein
MGWFTLVGGHVIQLVILPPLRVGISFFKKCLPSSFSSQDYLVDRYLLGIEGRKLKIKNPTPVHFNA